MMELGMIGLGKMGANMTTCLVKGGHRVVVYDRNPDAVKSAAATGAVATTSVEHLVEQLRGHVPYGSWYRQVILLNKPLHNLQSSCR
ncbi:MAG: decarboxylating 6-phosphogluconate dehydrogenase [Chloroflexi bacterium AL-W]|nr:decarboxylating 6-phosphogluconate dehydrogenase [Chloroflexi bacterium AL-N1]NOK71475.1 decarboxylating 6-phosphogluconate dehydrogenase [Chloroflexi bacterium AL-N10]NOK77256.1 decarboxylating 6-phosphogluconate dehydrogenase [Chloroflexi bacterium AL-N5]NOK86296.1 decarboxylating 6-phosphogluconate dehydrogenase [Chloroflexi bacterium AL-W]NOK93266.1 decarboxylating 6-phosphogluconate dehydrogenase [Chloroflexi bacterium AL-N15]